MGDLVIRMPDPAEMESASAPMVRRAMDLAIVDAETHGTAQLFLRDVAAGRKACVEAIAPTKTAANAAHKSACALEARVVKPWDEARAILTSKIIAFDAVQRRKAREEEERIAAAIHAEEEEQRLSNAIAAEEAGDEEQAAVILDTPAAVPSVTVEPEVAKVSGVSARTTWRAEVHDLRALQVHVAAHPECASYLVPSFPVLNSLARSQRDMMRIPGVRSVPEIGVSVRS